MMFTARIRNEILRLVTISEFMFWINKGYVSAGKALQIKARRRPGGKGWRKVVIKTPDKRKFKKEKRKEKTIHSKSEQTKPKGQSSEIKIWQLVNILAASGVSSVLKRTIFWHITQCSQLKVNRCSSETAVNFHRTVRHYILEDSTLHNHRCENLRSYKSCFFHPHVEKLRLN
jgi:hypothetical protein